AGRTHVHKLTGSSRTLLAAALHEKTKRPVLYVAADGERAEAARDDLEFWLDRERVVHFAQHDQPPYDTQTPHLEPTAARLDALVRLATAPDSVGVVVAAAGGLGQNIVGPDVLVDSLLVFKVGATLDLEKVTERLVTLGYERTPTVEDVGQFSRRGGILDVYSPGNPNPIRVEIDDDFTASMREFDVIHQRSIRPLDVAHIIPTHELALDPDRLELALLELEETKPDLAAELREQFETDLYPPGVEKLLPYLLQNPGSLMRYLRPGTIVVLEEPDLVFDGVDAQWNEATAAYEKLHGDQAHLAKPHDLYRSRETVAADLAAFDHVGLSALTAEAPGAGLVTIRSAPPDNFGRNLEMWRKYLVGLHEAGETTHLLCDNPGQKNRLDELLLESGTPVHLEVGILAEGFRLPDLRVAVLTDHEFFGRSRRARRARKFKSGFGLKEITSLRPGTYIVHIEHGIGIYRGISRLEINGQTTDCLLLEYGSGDRLYLPVDQLDRVQKFSADEESRPSLSRIGGTGWARTKEKAKKAIKEMAGELIALYARRRALPGHPFGPDTVWQQELEGTFPFDETPDQLKAVEDVTKDMESATPMDRLVCGDVGYGKTEVAVRAAFKAVMEGKQVAVLVPTTILAQQHTNTFRERYAGFPVIVELLSRFRSPKEQQEVLKGVAAGTVNVVIGTHALLAARVQFKELGLVIVDEEQRFGVAHKEKLRKMRTQVDVLTLTATPIPRTLNMAMLGARDISTITTPPRDRLPIHTEIVEFEDDLIQDALLREADRGGQSFFVHNRV
ncbi:MAG TPA: DEAD/DEAH box helicase, partial [Candidatus Eisenbacteria bacterium]